MVDEVRSVYNISIIRIRQMSSISSIDQSCNFPVSRHESSLSGATSISLRDDIRSGILSIPRMLHGHPERLPPRHTSCLQLCLQPRSFQDLRHGRLAHALIPTAAANHAGHLAHRQYPRPSISTGYSGFGSRETLCHSRENRVITSTWKI